MPKTAARHERRGADRPFNGDRRVCPKCGNRALEFNTRWRLPLQTGRSLALPAWICDEPSCGFRCAARRTDHVLMKSQAARQRAERALEHSRARSRIRH
jgi:hypothetical protein